MQNSRVLRSLGLALRFQENLRGQAMCSQNRFSGFISGESCVWSCKGDQGCSRNDKILEMPGTWDITDKTGSTSEAGPKVAICITRSRDLGAYTSILEHTQGHKSQMLDMELQDVMLALTGFHFALVCSIFVSHSLAWGCLFCETVHWRYVTCFLIL